VEAGLAKLAEKPVQLVWGAKDFCFSMYFYNRFKAFFPQAETVVFPKCGHYILEDAGIDAWQKIEAFLSD
jgi:haloalkane dehalogenase